MYYIDSKLLRTKLKIFFSDFWNNFEFFAIVGFTIGMILRFIPDNADCFKAAR